MPASTAVAVAVIWLNCFRNESAAWISKSSSAPGWMLREARITRVARSFTCATCEMSSTVNDTSMNGRSKVPVSDRATEKGIITRLSWLKPKISPRFSSTPTTLNHSRPINRNSPIGSFGILSSSRTSTPMTTTRRPPRSSLAVRKRPCRVAVPSTTCASSVVPRICGVTLRVRQVTAPRLAAMIGATSLTPGTL